MLTLGPLTDFGGQNTVVFGPDLGMMGPFSNWSPLTWVILHYSGMEIQAIMVVGETISYQMAASVAVTATIIATTVSADMVTASSESITFVSAGGESITSVISVNSGEVLQWQTP